MSNELKAYMKIRFTLGHTHTHLQPTTGVLAELGIELLKPVPHGLSHVLGPRTIQTTSEQRCRLVSALMLNNKEVFDSHTLPVN